MPPVAVLNFRRRGGCGEVSDLGVLKRTYCIEHAGFISNSHIENHSDAPGSSILGQPHNRYRR